MIALLDVKKQMVIIYTEKGIKNIPFSNISVLSDYTDKIMYITNAKIVETKDIVSLVKKIPLKYSKQSVSSTKSVFEEKGNKYIHSKSEGRVRIDDNLIFENRFDCRLIDDEMRKNIKSNSILQTLIQRQKIEIIGESGRSKLMKEKEIERKAREKKLKALEEKKSKKSEKALKQAKGEIDDDEDNDDIISIDLEEKGGVEVGSGLSVNTMSELLENL